MAKAIQGRNPNPQGELPPQAGASGSVPPRVKRSIEERNKLALEYLPLVRYHADRLAQRYPVPAEELESHGMLGLLKAADSYDPSRGKSASTWFAWRICNAIQDGLREHDFLSRGQRKKNPVHGFSIDPEKDDFAVDGFDPTYSIEEDDRLEYLMQGLALQERMIVRMYIRGGMSMTAIAEQCVPKGIRSKRNSVSKSYISDVWNHTIVPHMRERAAMLAA